MFDLLSRPLVFIPVKWKGVAEGKEGEAVPVEHAIDVQVEILDRVEFDKWIDMNRKDGDTPDVDPAGELAIFKTVAKGWRKIRMNGSTAQFTDDNIARMLRYPGFVGAFGEAYMETWAGRVAVREGNSDGSPANGPAGEPTVETLKDKTSPS
jgi:hypothetical protein